jgi:hypothetical protein
VYVECLVGRGEHLGLVDVVDAERLEHLRLGEVADPALGHHRDRDGLLDALDHRRVAHARDTTVAADVGRDALERHHRGRAGVFGDLGLLGRDDVHDDATPQHLREPALDPCRSRRAICRHVSILPTAAPVPPPGFPASPTASRAERGAGPTVCRPMANAVSAAGSRRPVTRRA